MSQQEQTTPVSADPTATTQHTADSKIVTTSAKKILVLPTLVLNKHPYGEPVLLAPSHYARMLYTNPVCVLTTSEPLTAGPQRKCNAMTISWLTPTTNVAGAFIMSMNETRFSATLLQKTRRFGTL